MLIQTLLNCEDYKQDLTAQQYYFFSSPEGMDRTLDLSRGPQEGHTLCNVCIMNSLLQDYWLSIT